MSYSNFPNELDYPSNFSYLSDLTSDDWAKIKRYNSLIQQETRTEEENNEITQLLIELQNKHITAEDINKIIDCIRAIEKVLYPISKGNIEGNLNVKGNVDVSGNISGNGSKLTNVNADTVDGKHAKDFTQYKVFKNTDDVLNERFVGLFKIEGDSAITGFSLLTNTVERKVNYDGLTLTLTDEEYIRVFTSEDLLYKIYSTAVASDEEGMIVYSWKHSRSEYFEFQGHKHEKADITDFPTALPANGGNADTVGGKSADEFATVSHTHTTSNITNFPTALPANGGNADTVGGKSAEELQNYNNLTNKPTSLPANGGNADTVGGKSAEEFYNKTPVRISATTNPTTLDSGIYSVEGELSIDNGFPLNAEWNHATIYVYGGKASDYGYRVIRYESIYNQRYIKFQRWGSWSEWISLTDAATVGGKTVSQLQDYNNLTNKPSSLPANGGNAETVNKVTKNFTVKKGSWFKFAKCKKALASGVFVLEVGSNNGCSSISTFSVSQAYSSVNTEQTKITELSHSSFNSCVTKVRLDTNYGDGVEQYIDFYIEDGSDNSTGYAIIQFFGQGWEVCDIESNNALTGYTTKELIL